MKVTTKCDDKQTPNNPTFDSLPVGTVFSYDGCPHHFLKLSNGGVDLDNNLHHPTTAFGRGRPLDHYKSFPNARVVLE